MAAAKEKLEYVGTMFLVANAPDSKIPITGLVEVEGAGYNVLLWVAEGKDGKETKLAYSGTLTKTLDDKGVKRGYIQLMKPKPEDEKPYVMYGWLKLEPNDDGKFLDTTHMVYLFKHETRAGVLRGGVSRFEQRSSSNVAGIPSVARQSAKQTEINYDDIPF